VSPKYAVRDLCDLGGWKNQATILKCYQRPSEERRIALDARQVPHA
jgi:hypothetical protein